MKLSIIIPAYNEEVILGSLLKYLSKHTDPETEIILADGGSTDATREVAREAGVQVLKCKQKGRGKQMNEGARHATGDILYFLHADTFPPAAFQTHIQQAVLQGYGSGCYRLVFDIPHWFLRLNAWFTRFDLDAVRFGDQSLFVRRDVFLSAGGFSESHLLLEDQEIIGRLKRWAPFVVLPAAVKTSARKYMELGVFRLQVSYYLIYSLYKLGVSQERLVQLYKRLLRLG